MHLQCFEVHMYFKVLISTYKYYKYIKYIALYLSTSTCTMVTLISIRLKNMYLCVQVRTNVLGPMHDFKRFISKF